MGHGNDPAMIHGLADPPDLANERLVTCDVLIVGGGVAGCSAAYYLAREGVEVLLLERDDLNTHGSGSNAGSLHVLILSRFFKSSDPLWVAGRERLLPLLLQAVESWHDIAGDLDCDIELDLTGGLMVAETEAQLRVLESKAKVERRHGLDVEILTGADLPNVAPYLSRRIIGAEYCGNEGKVNPILATPALARRAEAAGARILCGTELQLLEPAGKGFRARTSRGPIACRRVVNAAGAWADSVGAMVGLRIPVRRFPRHMNVTEAAPPLFRPLLQHADRLLTVKQAANGSVIVGGGWPSAGDAETGRLRVERSSIEGNLWVAQSVVPGLAGLSLVRTWPGVISMTPDGNGILGEAPGLRGFYNAVPPNSGYTAAPLCGRLLAEVMTGKPVSFDISGLALERFSSPAA